MDVLGMCKESSRICISSLCYVVQRGHGTDTSDDRAEMILLACRCGGRLRWSAVEVELHFFYVAYSDCMD